MTLLSSMYQNIQSACFDKCVEDNDEPFLTIKEGKCYRNCITKISYFYPTLHRNLENAKFHDLNKETREARIDHGVPQPSWHLDLDLWNHFYLNIFSFRYATHWPVVNIDFSSLYVYITFISPLWCPLVLTNPVKRAIIWIMTPTYCSYGVSTNEVANDMLVYTTFITIYVFIYKQPDHHWPVLVDVTLDLFKSCRYFQRASLTEVFWVLFWTIFTLEFTPFCLLFIWKAWEWSYALCYYEISCRK